MAQVALYLLGLPRVEVDGKEVHIGRRKALALLSYLVITKRKHSRDGLSAFLWPEYERSQALAYLRRVISELNSILGDAALEVDRDSCRINEKELWLDVSEFRKYLTAYESHSHLVSEMCEECIQHLENAAELCKGDFLEGFSLPDSAVFDEWQFFLTESLRQDLSVVLERLTGWHHARNEFSIAIPYARRWLSLNPLNESAHRCLMSLYADAGQKSAALHQYQICEKTLAKELNHAPSAETIALYESVTTQQAAQPATKALSTETSTSLTSDHKVPTNLPAQLTSFIGREKEIREVQEMLLRPDIRLLTLTGSGGTGKSRLSIAVAERLLNEFPDGVFFILLASLRDPALVMYTVAQTLGLRNAGDLSISDIIKYNLKDKKILLVLDNFEHLLQAAVDVQALLTALPLLKILITSRALLRLTGEYIYYVMPMSVPDAEAVIDVQHMAYIEAVQLFTDRAKKVKTAFTLTDENVAVVAEICKRVDGLPLAIELAAARIRLLTLNELVSQLRNRLHFLTGGAKDLPSRQRTLRNTIEWSHDLLSEEEQVLLRRLAVFAGGCTLQSAEAICNTPVESEIGSIQCVDVLDILERLVDQSLLQRFEAQDATRFTILETIREYAMEQLVLSHEIHYMQQAHAHFYLDLAEQAEPQLDGPEPAVWLGRMDSELDNFRAALMWSLDKDVAISLRLASALARFWIFQARLSEGRDWLEQAITRSEKKKDRFLALRGKALSAACEMAWCQGDSKKGIALGEQSVEIFRQVDDRRGLANALRSLGQATLSFQDSTMTLPLLEESITLYRSTNDDIALNRALIYISWKLFDADISSAHSTAEECFQIAQKSGSINHLAAAHRLLAIVQFNQGNIDNAVSHLNKSQKLFEQAGNKVFVPNIIELIGWGLFLLGQYDKAKRHIYKGLTLWRAMGNSANVAASHCHLASVAYHQGNLQDSKALTYKSLELSRSVDIHNHIVARCLLRLAILTDTILNPYRVAVLIGATEKFRTKTGIDPFDVRLEIDRLIGKLHNFMHKKDIDAAYNNGLSMTKEQAIDYALSEFAID
jgi:predicted ATPase/DNA-binding SARP family transcriptional activator